MKEAKRRRLFQLRRLVLSLVILFVFVVGTYFTLSGVFTIRQVEVVGGPVELGLNYDRFPKNLIFFPAGKLAAEILKEYPLIGEVKIKRKWPSTLLITLDVRQPLARMVIKDRVFLVDGEGVITGEEITASAYPSLFFTVDNYLTVGKKITDPRILAALTFLKIVSAFADISSITEADGASVRARVDKTDIFFPQTGDIAAKAATLQTILAGFRIKGTLPTIIDLRYDKPVVTFD